MRKLFAVLLILSGSDAAAAPRGNAIVSAVGSNMCLDDTYGGTGDGNSIELYSCNGTRAQRWAYRSGALIGPGGKCLDIPGNEQFSGAHLQLWTCNGTDAQRWAIYGSRIMSTTGLCLDVTGGWNADGTPVQIWDCNGTAAQQWTFE